MIRFKKYRNKLTNKRNIFDSIKHSNALPFIQIGSIIFGIIAVACLLIFLIVPIFSGEFFKPKLPPENTQQPIISPTPTPAIAYLDDIPNLSEDVQIQNGSNDYKSINSPFVCGDELVFTAGEAGKLNPPLKNIVIYNIATKQTTPLNLAGEYKTLLFSQISKDWIVYLDVNSKGGGTIWAYDRVKNLSFAVREYYYGMPKISLDGEYLAWVNQTGNNTDKLYIAHLPTNETAVIHIFSDTPTGISGCHMSNGKLVYTVSSSNSTDGLFNCDIKILDIKTNETTTFSPEMYVYQPKTNGEAIAFLDGNLSPDSNLIISVNGETPKVVDKGVLNYELGSNYVVYTKDDSVYIYFYKDGSKSTFNSKNLKGYLACASDKTIVWYDITDGFGMQDVLKIAILGKEKQASPAPEFPENSAQTSQSPNQTQQGN